MCVGNLNVLQEHLMNLVREQKHCLNCLQSNHLVPKCTSDCKCQNIESCTIHCCISLSSMTAWLRQHQDIKQSLLAKENKPCKVIDPIYLVQALVFRVVC